MVDIGSDLARKRDLGSRQKICMAERSVGYNYPTDRCAEFETGWNGVERGGT